MNFTYVRDKLKERIDKMFSDVDHLFVVDIDKDAFNDLYLNSFLPGRTAFSGNGGNMIVVRAGTLSNHSAM
jgi:hypothetical protein